MVSFTSTTAISVFAALLFAVESQAALPMLINKMTGKRSLVEMRGETRLMSRDLASNFKGCVGTINNPSSQPVIVPMKKGKVMVDKLPDVCVTEINAYKKKYPEKIQGKITVKGNSVILDATKNAELYDSINGDQKATGAAPKNGASQPKPNAKSDAKQDAKPAAKPAVQAN